MVQLLWMLFEFAMNYTYHCHLYILSKLINIHIITILGVRPLHFRTCGSQKHATFMGKEFVAFPAPRPTGQRFKP